jgi:outer membrane receptor protein involved in Fe transport
MRLVTILIFLCLGAWAQQDAGAVRVLVEDASGAVVPNASVQLTESGTNRSRSQRTSGEGLATFAPTPRGVYSVQISAPGFQMVQVSGIRVEVNQSRLQRVVLNAASTTETVQVTADAAPLNTEDGSLGQVIQGKAIVELPLAARRYTDLTLLVPGATESTLDANLRGPGWLVVNGNSHSQNNFVLDGFDNNQGTTNLQSRSAQVVQPSPDTLSEFKVMTNNFSAEFGRAAGAVVNASIKSGTNNFHGAGWWYNRDAALAANSWRSNLIGAPKDALKWNQPGGAIGGPVRRDKLFFFGDYEGFFSRTSGTQITQIPSQVMRNGDFSQYTFALLDPTNNQPFTNNRIPASRFDAIGKKLIDLYPAPNLSGVTASTGRPRENYGVQLPDKEDIHKWDVRVDYYQSERDRFFARYSWNRSLRFKDPLFPGLADSGSEDGGRQFAKNTSLGVSWNRNFTAALVNEFRVGYNSTESDFSHATAGGTNGTQFGFKGIPPELDEVGGIPRIAMSNYNSFGTGPWRPQFQNPDGLQINDTVSLVKGRHTIRAGADYRKRYNEWVDLQNRVPQFTIAGRYSNDDAADLLLGLPQDFRGQSFFVAEQRQQAWSAFFQDDWKVRGNLTLNLGIRYEYWTPYYGTDRFPNINVNNTTGQLLIAGTRDLVFGAQRAENRYGVNPDRNNISPRLGAAWQVRPWWVLRGGYGIFYHGEDFRGSTGNILINAPNTYSVTIQRQGTGPAPVLLSGTLPSDFLDIRRINPANLGFEAQSQDWKASFVHQWNVSTQFQVMKSATFELAYVGNRAFDLPGNYNLNRTQFGVDGSIIPNRAFPQFNSINLLEYRGTSNYNALQAKFENRFTQSWYNLTSYTYAAGLATTGGFEARNGVQRIAFNNGRAPIADWEGERGFHNQLTRHRLSIANVYQLPVGRGRAVGGNLNRWADLLIGGWQTSQIMTVRSGLPVDVSISGSGNDPLTRQAYAYLPNSGGGSYRPDRVGNPQTGIDPKIDRFRFLDVQAYRLPAAQTAGNAARNSAWGPGFLNVDFGVTKRIPLTESKYFDIRWEFFNILNRTNFRNPNGNWVNAAFGNINNAFSPRQIQGALRFAF